MKKCPYCAEEIQDDAIKCRYCGSDLSASTVSPEIMSRFGRLRYRMRSKDYATYHQVKEISPTAFELWTRPTGVNAFALILLLLIGILPGLIYAVVKATETERRIHHLEIKQGRIFRDGKDVTESSWLRERIAKA